MQKQLASVQGLRCTRGAPRKRPEEPLARVVYDGPLDVYENATLNFNTVAFWYAVTFPKFGGYRVEHDPVYTAYSNIGQAAPGIPGFPWEAILIGVVVCLVAVFLVRRRKKV